MYNYPIVSCIAFLFKLYLASNHYNSYDIIIIKTHQSITPIIHNTSIIQSIYHYHSIHFPSLLIEVNTNANLKYAQKKQLKSIKKQNYIPQLLLAIGQIALYLCTITTTIILMVDWFKSTNDLNYYAWIICMVYAWKTIIQFIIGILSSGPKAILLGIFDLLQLREFWYFIVYVKHWPKHHNATSAWKRCYYLPHQPFVSTMATFPSLVLQAYVMILLPDDVSGLQIITMIATTLYLFLEFIAIFHYLTVSPRVYSFMMISAILSNCFRIIAVAFLIRSIKAYTFIAWLGSYIFGLFIVIWIGFIRRQRLHRDDPLQLTFLKIIYAHQVAVQLTFASVPFAPQHSVFEWWYGYIVSEIKMIIEFGIAIASIVFLYPYERSVAFYTLFAVGLFGIIVQTCLVFFMNMGVSRSLRRRSLFSTTKIVTFFVYFGNYLQEKFVGQQRDATKTTNTTAITITPAANVKTLSDDKSSTLINVTSASSLAGWTSMHQEKQFNAHMQAHGPNPDEPVSPTRESMQAWTSM